MPPTTKRPIRGVARFLPGASLAVIGSLAAIAGGGLLAAFGTDGRLASGPHPLSTRATAIVSPITSIKNTSGIAALTGKPTLRISASPVQRSAGVFVGIGPAADVDRYLARVSTERITSLNTDPYTITQTTRSGQTTPRPPATQPFWVARSTSTHTTSITWKIRDGRYRLVIMNANGQPGLATSTAIGITTPNIAYLSLAGLIIGLLMAGGGTALLIRAASSPAHHNTAVRAPSPVTTATI